jgi:biofilm protein TabA
MIWGDLQHWDQEKGAFHPVLQQAVEWLRSNDLEALEVGTYEIEGQNMFAMVQAPSTVVRSERKSEHHAQYLDVQYLIGGGEELQVVGRQSGSNVAVENRLDDRDYALFTEVQNENEIYLQPGMFVVYFPNDLHRPNCSRTGDTHLKKVVIKINKELMGL